MKNIQINFVIFSIAVFIFFAFYVQTEQDITGKIIDSETRQTIPFVHIYFKQTSRGTVSNNDGYFSINKISTNNNDTIVITHVGYETLLLPVGSLNQGNNDFYLVRSVYKLNDVVITNLTPFEIVKKAIQHTKALESKNLINFGFYRTASKQNGVFMRIFEAAVDIQDNSNVDYLNIIRSRDYRHYLLPEFSDLEDALYFDHVNHLRGFLNLENEIDWQYEIESYSRLGNLDVYQISANYVASKELHHFGKLYITDDFRIIKIEYEYLWNPEYPNRKVKDSISFAPCKWSGVFNYSYRKDKIYINHFTFINENYLLDLNNKRKLATLEVYNEFTSEFTEEKRGSETDSGSRTKAQNTNSKLKFNVPLRSDLFIDVMQDIDSIEMAKKNKN